MPNLRLGSVAPDFTAETTHGTLSLHEYLGDSWGILFSHPDDFTPVCTTELGEVARKSPEFKKRGVKVIGLSANDVASHDRWIADIEEIAKSKVDFPIIGDKDRKIATEYDMLDALDATNVDAKGIPFTVRDVFVIDPKKVIRLKISYPASTGRHFDEIIRVIDSLQIGDKHKITTPVNWQKGDKVIVHPSVQGEDVKKLFPDVEVVKPYLRFTKDPTA
ncbi:unnamed protein product [Tilletia controversa]|uniref:Thioredoxin domain-containing protein n=3 Tax=Tilletia TaxID=13289 RepID=A0A8X7MRE8_9BASI|nr:hypothetical protein CF336_g3919 [Tilletia laevis]KAE8196791.1 hypothetical protein CF328_g4034 [Tilletia controversa]KAE8260118.1 hypothetical protein A4X03_0g3909 [Tilletia caries]KAE8201410.1 hypothetical protein CF335_g3745 [Tilletia laevis]KAE8246420.1 hypothetical protein A4X06_0g5021 [Tilletia controversa]